MFNCLSKNELNKIKKRFKFFNYSFINLTLLNINYVIFLTY